MDYAVQNQQQLNLSDAVMAVLLDDAYANGIYNFTQQHLSYPPQGHIYPPKEYSSNYAPWNDVYLATNASRACFDIYDISQDCPLPRDPLGFDGVTQTFDPDNWINTTPGVVRSFPFSSWLSGSQSNIRMRNGRLARHTERRAERG